MGKQNSERKYVRDTNHEHISELKFKENGHVDLSVTPEGFAFERFILGDPDRADASSNDINYAKEMNMDPRFVMYSNVGSMKRLCYFVLVPEVIAGKTEQTYKTEDTKAKRRCRCRIMNPVTGNEMDCPYDRAHNCDACHETIVVHKDDRRMLPIGATITTEAGEEYTIDPADDVDVAALAEDSVTRDMIRSELDSLDAAARAKGHRAVLRQVFEAMVRGYKDAEICVRLGISKSSMSCYRRKIEAVAQKYFTD